MNFFQRRIIDRFNQEGQPANLEKYEERTESKESVLEKTGIQSKHSYYPNPALFRRLIEGTSFDRRKKLKEEQKNTKKQEERKAIPPSQSSQPLEQMSIVNVKERRQWSTKTYQKKKFINKERENRLGNIVHEVLKNSKR